jgi:Helix-turn-helix domain
MNVPITPSLLEGYVDEPEASRQLQKHPRTLKRYRDQQNGLPHVKVGNRVLYRVEAVRGWLLARERRPNPRRPS